MICLYMPKMGYERVLQAKILQFYVQKHAFYKCVGEGGEKNLENAPPVTVTNSNNDVSFLHLSISSTKFKTIFEVNNGSSITFSSTSK